MTHGRKPSTRRFDRYAPLRLLANARPHDPGEKTPAHIRTMDEFERLRTGCASTLDFDSLAMVLNMAKVRAMAIDETLADMIERAQDAMMRCKARSERIGGRLVLDGSGYHAISEALLAAQQIIDASSPLQMLRARDAVTDAMYGKGTAARLTREARQAHTAPGTHA